MALAQLEVGSAGTGLSLCTMPTAFSNGKVSTKRTNSSNLKSKAGVSATAVALMRSMSRVKARSTGARRGWATLVSRCSAELSAANSGCTLPVSWACCCAKRIADSISTTKFSSRERDKLCISSSSWLRCRATSLSLASVTDRRAAVSRASSSACLDITRASTACVPVSAL